MLKNTALNRPPVSPRCYVDESPIGFLNRVAAANCYTNYKWLLTSSADEACTTMQSRLYNITCESEWTGFNRVSKFSKEMYQLDFRSVASRIVKYCPDCLIEKKYWRAKWQLNYTFTCLKHKVWLRDQCPTCDNYFLTSFGSLDQCSCGDKITYKNGEPAPLALLSWQRFVEGCDEQLDEGFPQLLPKPSIFNLKERLKIGLFFLSWMRKIGPHPTQDATFIHVSSEDGRAFVHDAADILFSGRAGYRSFLLRLMANTNDPTKTAYVGFGEFYRNFNKMFQDDRYAPLKKLNDEIVSYDWKKSLSRRNRIFSPTLITSHKWIPFQVACRRYGIHRSVLRRAIQELSIAHEVSHKENRDFVDIFEPDLQRKLYKIKDCITSKEAATILGITKLQFSQLREAEYFKCVSPPKVGYNQEWQFSRDEILEYLEKLIANETPPIGEVFSIAQILKYYGGKLKNPLTSVLAAVERGNLRCRGTKAKAQGIRALLVDREEFLNWHAQHKRNSSLMTITQTAKVLGVNQEITYQLVSHALLQHKTVGKSSAKWISEKQISEFRKKYVLLSKLSKALGLQARSLMAYLKGYEIFPIDKDTPWKLRQKVYLREELLGVTLLEEALCEC